MDLRHIHQTKAELGLKMRFASPVRTLAPNSAVAMALKLASQTDSRCLQMDECTASNNSSLWLKRKPGW